LLVESTKAKGGGDTSTGARQVPVQEAPTLTDMGIDEGLLMPLLLSCG